MGQIGGVEKSFYIFYFYFESFAKHLSHLSNLSCILFCYSFVILFLF